MKRVVNTSMDNMPCTAQRRAWQTVCILSVGRHNGTDQPNGRRPSLEWRRVLVITALAEALTALAAA
jgi:hypothetical protein